MQATGDDSQFKSAHAKQPMIPRPAGTPTPHESNPVDPDWPQSPIPAVRSEELPSLEESPHPPARYEEQYYGEMQPGMSHPVQPEHPSSMQSLGSSSFNSTGIPASPDLAIQPSGLVAAAFPEGARPPSAMNPGQRTYAFVTGGPIRRRPRRRDDGIERLYSCSFEDCTKAYGTLNHLNAHVTMQKHGPKRNPSEFKELRKLWRTQKKAEQMANRPRRRRGVGQDDDAPHGLHRTSSGSFSSPGAGYSDESDEGTPQPVDAQQQQDYGQVDQMWQPDMMHGYGHGHGMGMPNEGQGVVMERIPPNATLLQSLPPTHPSHQHQQYSGSMHQPQAMSGYGGMAARGARESAKRMANHLRGDCKMGLDDDVTYAIESYLVKFFL